MCFESSSCVFLHRLDLFWMSAMFKLSHIDVEDNKRHITSIDKFISALKLLIPGWSMLAA